jgi:transposase
MSMDKSKSFWDEIQEKYEISAMTYMPANYLVSGLKIQLELRNRQKRPSCEICNGKPNIHDYTDKEVTFGTLNGCPVTLCFKHCRYQCKRCDITFMEEFACLTWHSGLTTDAKNYIISKLGSQTFTDIANEIGYCVQPVSNIACEYGATERELQLKSRCRYLSMDEIFISRDSEGNPKYYWVLNDISTPWKSNNIRIDEGRNKEDVIKRLGGLAHQERVLAVCIDMWKPYRDAISEVFPRAAVVVDPFHVIQAAQREMEKVRKGAKADKDTKAAFKKDSQLFLTSMLKLSNNELDRLESYLHASAEIEKAYFIVQELIALYRLNDYE